MKSYYDLLKSVHHTVSNKYNNTKHTCWKFYDNNNNLIILNNETGYIKTSNLYYKFNKWYIYQPDLKIIKNIKEFVNTHKLCIQKMNKYVKNNFIMINRLNLLLKNMDKFIYGNFYGWKFEDDFYLKIDLYKSPLLDNIYIKTGNRLKCNEQTVNFKILFKILRDINIINFIKKNSHDINDINFIKTDESQFCTITDNFDKLKINNTSRIDKQINYDEIRNESPELFIKLSKEKKLTFQSCKNFWEFIDFEQMVE